jgi:hypothetical protein
MEFFMKSNFLAALLLCPMIGGANAAKFSYSYVEASYGNASYEDFSYDASGFSLDGSLSVHPNIFLIAGFTTVQTEEIPLGNGTEDKIRVDGKDFGVGVNFGVGDKIDLVATVAQLYSEVEFDGESEESDSTVLEAGFRSMISRRIELDASVDHEFGDDEDTSGYSVGLRLYLSKEFSLGFGISSNDNVDVRMGSLRLSF